MSPLTVNSMYLLLSEFLSPMQLHVPFILYNFVLAVVIQGKFSSILKFSNLIYFVAVLLILALITDLYASC